MGVIILIVIIVIIIALSNSGSSTKKTILESESQRQARLQREKEAKERQTALDRQNQIERERQTALRRQQAEAEQQRRQAEQNRQAEQRQIEELQRLSHQVATFKTNWQDFQRVLLQHGITKLYHFTDRANLRSIRTNGGLYSWHYCQQNNIPIPKPGGSSTSWGLDQRKGLQNFVRVSFVKDHPMLYVAQQDGRITSPVILEINIELIYKSTTRYATQNAAKNGVTTESTFEKFNSIQFPLLRRRYFDLSAEEKPFYQAEILVLEKIPLEYITNINSV
jgi:hypothetical protein